MKKLGFSIFFITLLIVIYSGSLFALEIEPSVEVGKFKLKITGLSLFDNIKFEGVLTKFDLKIKHEYENGLTPILKIGAGKTTNEDQEDGDDIYNIDYVIYKGEILLGYKISKNTLYLLPYLGVGGDFQKLEYNYDFFGTWSLKDSLKTIYWKVGINIKKRFNSSLQLVSDLSVNRPLYAKIKHETDTWSSGYVNYDKKFSYKAELGVIIINKIITSVYYEYRQYGKAESDGFTMFDTMKYSNYGIKLGVLF